MNIHLPQPMPEYNPDNEASTRSRIVEAFAQLSNAEVAASGSSAAGVCVITPTFSGVTSTQVGVRLDTSALGTATKPTVKLLSLTAPATLVSGAVAGAAVPSGNTWVFARGDSTAGSGYAVFLATMSGYAPAVIVVAIPARAQIAIAPTPVWWDFPAVTAPLSRTGWTATAARGTGAANAIDGTTSSRYTSNDGIAVGTDYLQLALGGSVTVGSLLINNYSDTGDMPTSGDVKTSPDGTAWTTVASWVSSDITGGGSQLQVSWAPAACNYIRVVPTGTANGASSNWWSVYEINLYASTIGTPLQFNASTAVCPLTPYTVTELRGTLLKTDTTENLFVGVGADYDNGYGLRWGSGSSSVLLVKRVAGAESTLKSLAVDNDTAPRAFRLVIITPGGSGRPNLIEAHVERTQNTMASAATSDSAINMTSGADGHFWLYANELEAAQGCFFTSFAALSSARLDCTSASGGDVVYQSGIYRVHRFTDTSSAKNFVVSRAGKGDLNYAVVAGGGGGDGTMGGGGGDVKMGAIPLLSGSYVINVGAVGAHSTLVPPVGSTISASNGGVPGVGGYGAGSPTAAGGSGISNSVGCADSPPSSYPCTAGVNVGGGGGGYYSAGVSGALVGHSFDCSTGTCVSVGTWGKGGDGITLGIGNDPASSYTSYLAGRGGFGSGTKTGGGSVSGPTLALAPGVETFGSGGDGSPGGTAGTGEQGIVLVWYEYNPEVCGA